MPISYPLSLPDNRGMAQISITMLNVVALSQSPFTFASQALKYSGEAWRASVNLPPMKRDDAEEWVSFLASLSGKMGTFLMGDPNGELPQGAALLSPSPLVVSGSNQTGTDIVVSGAPPSISQYLKKGDYVQFGSGATSKLHKLLRDADSNSDGAMNLVLWPSVKVAPSNNSSVTFENARGVFRLMSNEQSFSINEISSYGISFDCMEAF